MLLGAEAAAQGAPGPTGGATEPGAVAVPWWRQGGATESSGPAATGTRPDPAESGAVPARAPADLGPASGRFRWRQVMAAPRLGGRLTAVAVDPADPQHVVVGTEEGTVLVTEDGGVTWRELEIGPFVFQARQVRMRVPGLPRLGERTPLGFTFFTDPPYRARPPDRVTVPMHNLFFSVSPEFISVGATPRTSRAPSTLLRDAVGEARSRTVPARNLAFCPGAPYPLLLATSRELLGSPDGGYRWVRLMRLPGRVGVYWVACSRDDPRRVALGTGFGLFVSSDGGLSWDQETSGWPGRPAQALAFARAEDGGERFVVATGYILYAGRLGGGLQRVYPDFRDTSTAPWKTVRWVEVAPSGSLWLGTDDGVRFAERFGARWQVAARHLFDRHRVAQVVAGAGESGAERIAVLVRDCATARRCRQSRIYASDDGGRSWFPFFDGLSRRSIVQVAASRPAPGRPGRWWLVAGGELWATDEPAAFVERRPVDEASRRWAERRLLSTPRLAEVQEAVLRRLGLALLQEGGLFARERARGWLPVLDAQLFYGQVPAADDPLLDVLGGYPRGRSFGTGEWARETIVRAPEPPFAPTERRSGRLAQRELYFFVQATWRLGSLGYSASEGGIAHRRLYALRRQVLFAVEDAWHERMLHLRRLARGVGEPWQAATLRSRVEALEAILQTWLRGPLSSVAPMRTR